MGNCIFKLNGYLCIVCLPCAFVVGWACANEKCYDVAILGIQKEQWVAGCQGIGLVDEGCLITWCD